MASTPPLQIASSTPQTPPTPLHGAAYDHRPTRISSRIAARQVHSTPDTSLQIPSVKAPVTTPKSLRQSRALPAPGIQSPASTPRNKSTRRVQVISPASPETDTQPPKPMPRSKAQLQSLTSATTTISDGMLPTPVKTPKKKAVSVANNAARALFQDNVAIADFEPSPRRNRKAKRYNGFSLESFAVENAEGRQQIQIYTDSRDRVPQADNSQANPFIEQDTTSEPPKSRKVAGTTKRRKISGERKKVDPQVAAAIDDDEGMVYVFRGKKVYRRFDAQDDEEEEISADDLGLLEHSPPNAANTKSLKTLSRRSIKPKRLFQTEAQTKARQAQEEEEALTDIDEATLQNGDDDHSDPTSPTIKTGRFLRSTGKTHLLTHDIDSNSTNGSPSKKTSPFDAWPRLKTGGSAAVHGHKGRKRSAPEAIDEILGFPATEAKKTRT